MLWTLVFVAWLLYSVFVLGKRLLMLFPPSAPLDPEKQRPWSYAIRSFPVMRGTQLNILRWLSYTPVLGSLYLALQQRLLKLEPKTTLFDFDFKHEPGVVQSNAAVCAMRRIEAKEEKAAPAATLQLGAPARNGHHMANIDDYLEAYRSKKTTPVAVAEKLIRNVRRDSSTAEGVHAIVVLHEDDLLQQARESAKRYEDGTAREFEGVPITIKDEIPIRGYKNAVGTNFLGKEAAKSDSVLVQRLREAGFLIAGVAAMQEIGIMPFGYNKNSGHCKSPFDLEWYACVSR